MCGLTHASTTEIEPDCPQPVIDILPEQKKLNRLGGNMRLGGQDVILTPGSLASRLFGGAERIRLRFRHRYEVNPDYVAALESHGAVFSGRNPDGRIMQVLELPTNVHPYFVSTQAHPELTSRPLHAQPMFVGLVEAVLCSTGVTPHRRRRGEAEESSPTGAIDPAASSRT
jgi:CTP synthase